MDETSIREALFQLLKQDIGNKELVHGIALGLSAAGKSRVEIMTFYWDFMVQYRNQLTERQRDVVSEFCYALMGNGPIQHFIRLHGDPEAPEAFIEKVRAEAELWEPPVRSDSQRMPSSASPPTAPEYRPDKTNSNSPRKQVLVMTRLEKKQSLVLDLTQAMLGAISPNFRAVALSLGEQGVLLTFVLEHESPEDREEIEDIEIELEALHEDPINVGSQTIISKAPIDPDELPGILVYRRRDPGSLCLSIE